VKGLAELETSVSLNAAEKRTIDDALQEYPEYDRWDLRQLDEESGLRRSVLQLVKANGLTKLIADVLVPGCSYAAIKPVR